MFIKPTKTHALGDKVIAGLFNKFLGWPGKLQGMLSNALLSTIDRIQTEQALKETKDLLERERKAKSDEPQK